MRSILAGLGLLSLTGALAAQAPGKFPPDSLVNLKVIPRTTPVMEVVGMMRMVQEINRRLDSLPGRTGAGLLVACVTCHRGISRPLPLVTVMVDAATAAGADSAVRAYRALRERFYGRDAYDFGQSSLNNAALRLGRARRFDDAMALLKLNEESFPSSAGLSIFRGNVHLMRGDSASAAAAFREAIRRDSTNNEARARLRDIGQRPTGNPGG